jgi:hypothetical protein
MGEIIKMFDINGNGVLVDLTVALAAIGDTLLDDESHFVPRTKQPLRYVKVCIVDDSEVPG